MLKPNIRDTYLSSLEAPYDLTATTFVIVFDQDKNVIMMNNKKRGLELSGGHIEVGENPQQAARREAREEVDVEVGELVPIGYQMNWLICQKPDNYQYPYPISYQQFYTARMVKKLAFKENDECDEPLILPVAMALQHLKLSGRKLLEQAAEIKKNIGPNGPIFLKNTSIRNQRENPLSRER